MSATSLGIIDARALGGHVRLIVTARDRLEAAWAALEAVLAEIDLAASRFRSDSELSLLNARPERETKVSPLLANAISQALRGARLTDGAVDPTVGHAIRLAGYDADFASVPAHGTALNLAVKRIPGWQAVQLHDASRTVRLPKGVELDLGATAKALAADMGAQAAMKAAGEGGVLVSLGGDIALAGEAPPDGWAIQVSEDSAAPIRAGEETIAIASGGVATSSTTVRRWTRGGVILHHIIDPSTGTPVVGPWRTATVVAATCVDANIASTAAIVKGEEATTWLEAARVPARLVGRSGEVVRLGGWPDPQRSTRGLTANSQEIQSRFVE